MRDLYVSLGHNASAVLAVDGMVTRGYEQERFDRVKSSSAFPTSAIEHALGRHHGEEFCDRVFVSHWFDHFELSSNKYLNLSYLNSLSPHLISLTPDFTHHDAHAQSSIDFLEARRERKKAYVVVIDGFGNNQECLSVYEHDPHQMPKLIHRTYGYAESLGLMYQYTTEFLGLKPNRDEYKLLGYESDVLGHVPRDLATQIYGIVSRHGIDHAHRMLSRREKPRPVRDALIDYNRLVMAKCAWQELAEMWRKMWELSMNAEGVRACVGFCAQTFLESAALEIVDRLCLDRSRDLILSGGVFLNVKLSRRIRLMWGHGNVFVHPLCGDQGAAMGHTPKLQSSGLCWGERSLHTDITLPKGCEFSSENEWVSRVLNHFGNHVTPVNVVRGAAEFGPRALCNTTTLASPTRASVKLINALNERDEAMPMAPVMTRVAASKLLDDDEVSRSDVSNRFMVTTVGFKEKLEALGGVAHDDPLGDWWTARPQIVDDDDPMAAILCSVPHQTLINTSFNFHGEPIVQSAVDAIHTHQLQCARARELEIPEPLTLLVLP